MVSTTRSRNLVPKHSTPSKDKPAEEEPVIHDNVKITQDDENFDTENVNSDDIDTAINANPTSFRECTDEVFAKSVNQQHYLANPHLPNPNITKAEHVAKQAEMFDNEGSDEDKQPEGPEPAVKETLPPAGPPTPVPKPTIAPTDTASSNLQNKLDSWLFFYHQPCIEIKPKGNCQIAKALTVRTFDEQETQAKEFFNFLSQHQADLEILNAETTTYTFLMHVPGTRSLKVCYGMGSGVSYGGLRGSTINDKALALSGDYQEGTKYPSILTFPIYDMSNPDTVKSPTYKQLFELNLSFGARKPSASKLTFFKSTDLTETAKLHHLAPIPAFLVADHIDENIDVFTIIDRLLCIQQTHLSFTDTKCELVYKHALNYCLNALVSRNKKEPTVTFPVTHFMDNSNSDANAWKLQRLKQQFPLIFDTSTQATAPAKPAATPSPPLPTVQHTKPSNEDETTRLLKLYHKSTKTTTTNRYKRRNRGQVLGTV